MESKEAKENETYAKALTVDSLSDAVLKAEYAVRGAIVQRAKQIAAELKKNPNTKKNPKENKYPFSKIIFCNIGNPQAFVKPPLTFHRQILACLLCPDLMEKDLFNKDVIQRAQRLLNDTPAKNIGAYSASVGLNVVRESVISYIAARDGSNIESNNISNIMLTAGASTGIRYTLQCLCANNKSGILIPIPQYPLYSATICLNNGCAVPYYLDEEKDWSASIKSIEESIKTAIEKIILIYVQLLLLILVIQPVNVYL